MYLSVYSRASKRPHTGGLKPVVDSIPPAKIQMDHEAEMILILILILKTYDLLADTSIRNLNLVSKLTLKVTIFS